MSDIIHIKPALKQGDRWTQVIGFKKVGFIWTSATVRAVLRIKPKMTVAYTFSGLSPLSISVDEIQVVLQIPGDDSALLATGNYLGEVTLENVSFGPHTPIKFLLPIIPRITT